MGSWSRDDLPRVPFARKNRAGDGKVLTVDPLLGWALDLWARVWVG